MVGARYDYRRAVDEGGRYRTICKAWLELACDPGDPRHGSEWGYACGCRCDRCRDAHNRRARDAYRRRRGGV